MEEMVYRFIVLCKGWKFWKNATVIAGGKKYTDCKKDDPVGGFRDLKDVKVSELTEDDMDDGKDTVLYWSGNVNLELLLRYGSYEVYLEDMPFAMKKKYLEKNPDFLEEWEYYLEEDVEHNPSETIGIDPCDFDSYSEYENFKDEMIEDAYIEFIENFDVDFWNKIQIEDEELVRKVSREFFEFVKTERLFPIISGERVEFCKVKEKNHRYNSCESLFLLQCWARAQW